MFTSRHHFALVFSESRPERVPEESTPVFGDWRFVERHLRTFTETLDQATVARARRAIAGVRAGVWRRTSISDGDGPVVLDVDATLVEIRPDNKQGTTAYYRGGSGSTRRSVSLMRQIELHW